MIFFEHEFIEGNLDLFEPTTTHHFDQGFQSIDSELTDHWDPRIDGPIPQENDSDYEPYNWYTIEWWEKTLLHRTIDCDGYTFRDLFDYQFSDYDYSIHSYDHLDEY